MVRPPCCDDIGLKKGPWTPEEDKKLVDYIRNHGHGSWRHLPKLAGLNRCGKSCRLRWMNYLRPDVKRGKFSNEEEQLIIHLHSILGNKWSAIATRLPGRTDNEIKNYWNTHLRKKLLLMGIDPVTHRPRTDLNLLASLPNLIPTTNPSSLVSPLYNALRLQADAAQLTRFQLLQSLIQIMIPSSPPNLDAMNLFAVQNYQRADLLQLNHQLDSLINGFIAKPMPNNFQAFAQADGACSADLVIESDGGASDHQMFNSCNIATANSTPSLVPASPENVASDRMQDPIKYSIDASANSSTSITSETWEGLNLSDLDGDLSWKGILDQISWSNDK